MDKDQTLTEKPAALGEEVRSGPGVKEVLAFYDAAAAQVPQRVTEDPQRLPSEDDPVSIHVIREWLGLPRPTTWADTITALRKATTYYKLAKAGVSDEDIERLNNEEYRSFVGLLEAELRDNRAEHAEQRLREVRQLHEEARQRRRRVSNEDLAREGYTMPSPVKSGRQPGIGLRWKLLGFVGFFVVRRPSKAGLDVAPRFASW